MNEIERYQNIFESLKQMVDGVERWSARDLMSHFGYRKWERMSDVIDRARIACQNSGFEPVDHFPGAGKMVGIGSGAQREAEDFLLSRYAAYLVAMNGDPRKIEIAAAQTYFCLQTRKAEVGQLSPVENSDPLSMALIAALQLRQAHMELEKRVSTIEDQQHEAREALLALPEAVEPAPIMPTRKLCIEAMEYLSTLTGLSPHDAWRRIYRRYDHLFGCNLTRLAENRNMSKIEYLARNNCLEKLYGVIQSLTRECNPAA